MPIRTLLLLPAAADIQVNDIAIINTKPWVVWWYNGVFKNHKEQTSPKVLVTFRVLDDDYSLSDVYEYRPVPLTLLGKFRIGSVWLHGQMTHAAQYEESIFDVSFDESAWNFTSAKIPFDGRPPYPDELHPFWKGRHDSWLVEFKLHEGGYLVIPCLEVFTRLYGRSQEIKRVLATYLWRGTSDCAEARLLPPTDEHEEAGLWKIKLPDRMVQGDAAFLAHLKYSSYTRSAAQSIHAQIEAEYRPDRKQPLFLKIKPWFQGSVRIKVRGYSFGQSFLGLQILGCSDPVGLPVICVRDTIEKDDKYDENSSSSQTIRAHNNPLSDTKLHITGNQAPDRESSTRYVTEDAFEILGEPQEIRHVRRSTKRSHTLTSGVKPEEQSHATVSDADPHGHGKGILQGQIHAPKALESHGALRDIWDALNELQKREPGRAKELMAFTFRDGFQACKDPQLIVFRAIYDDSVQTAIRNWAYIDPREKLLRGVLVIRIKINQKYTYFVEIQRRIWDKSGANCGAQLKEESLKGMVFRLNDESHLKSWLSQLLSAVRYKKGVMSGLTNQCPGVAATYSHIHLESDKYPYQQTIETALAKLSESTKE